MFARIKCRGPKEVKRPQILLLKLENVTFISTTFFIFSYFLPTFPMIAGDSCHCVKQNAKQNVKMPPQKSCRWGHVPPLPPPPTPPPLLRTTIVSKSVFKLLASLTLTVYYSIQNSVKYSPKIQEMPSQRLQISQFFWGACLRIPQKLLAPSSLASSTKSSPFQNPGTSEPRPALQIYTLLSIC